MELRCYGTVTHFLEHVAIIYTLNTKLWHLKTRQTFIILRHDQRLGPVGGVAHFKSRSSNQTVHTYNGPQLVLLAIAYLT